MMNRYEQLSFFQNPWSTYIRGKVYDLFSVKTLGCPKYLGSKVENHFGRILSELF